MIRENLVSTITFESQPRITRRGAYWSPQFGAKGITGGRLFGVMLSLASKKRVTHQSRSTFFSVAANTICTPLPSTLRLQTDPIPDVPPGPQSIMWVTPLSAEAGAIAFGQL